jgi:hypothetical protein
MVSSNVHLQNSGGTRQIMYSDLVESSDLKKTRISQFPRDSESSGKLIQSENDFVGRKFVELPENLSVLLSTLLCCASYFHVLWQKQRQHGKIKKLPTGETALRMVNRRRSLIFMWTST